MRIWPACGRSERGQSRRAVDARIWLTISPNTSQPQKALRTCQELRAFVLFMRGITAFAMAEFTIRAPPAIKRSVMTRKADGYDQQKRNTLARSHDDLEPAHQARPV